MKPVGAKQRKSRKAEDKNHALASWRKWKRIEKKRRAAEEERYNSLCGPVTITYINR